MASQAYVNEDSSDALETMDEKDDDVVLPLAPTPDELPLPVPFIIIAAAEAAEVPSGVVRRRLRPRPCAKLKGLAPGPAPGPP